MDVAKQAYYQAETMEEEEGEEEDDDEESANPRDVGHNIYILAHQVDVLTHWGQSPISLRKLTQV